MNILAIDIGNTRIKWGFSDSGAWLRQGWVATGSAAELVAELAGLPAAQRTVISNVAGAAVRAQVAAVLNAAAPEPVWITSAAAQCGVSSGYAAPETLGPDRWAALIGAWQLTGTACVVVNVGTTMTVDALSAEGVFLGGCIVPGATLMRNALARDTANLAARDGAFSYFPDNTGDAIFSGAVNALAGAVERMLRYLEESAGTVPPVLLSGGGAVLIEKRLNAAVTVVDNLVLEGLLQIALQPGTGQR
jgi:type III pantothenate kinase